MSIKIEDLSLANDFIFSEVMRQPENVRPFLEALLGKRIGEIKSIDKQKDIKDGISLHGIRLDIALADEQGVQYDIEMQAGNAYDLEKRIRYYQSSIDRRTLEASENYRDLRQSYVIFLCTDDYYKCGLALYKRKSIIEGTDGIVYEDGSHAYILNASFTIGNSSEAVHDFLRYIDAGYRKKQYDVSHSDYLTKIDHAVSAVKNDERKVESYMTLAMKLQDERWAGREEGRAEGETANQTKTISRMFANGFSLEDVCLATGLSPEEVKKLAEHE